MLKKILITLFLFLNIINLFSQHRITGKVINSNKIPLQFSNIVIFNIKSNLINTGTITNENGEFEINLEKECECKISISYIGFQDWEKDINFNESLDFGKITLIENNTLDKVTITTSKKIITKQQDKIIFNVQNSPLKAGYDITELLKVTPNVWVGIDNNISIHGEKATILINGRKINLSGDDVINYLSDISSENIKQIEIQTNQSASSDATTTGGIINIILKKRDKGFSARLNTFYTYKGKGYNGYSGINLNYGTEKWNIYSSYSFGIFDVFTNEINLINFLELKNKIETNTEKNRTSINNNYKVGFTNQISKNHLIGFELFGRHSNNNRLQLREMNYYNDNNQINSGFTDVDGNGNGATINGLINYKWTISKNENVKVYIDYSNNKSHDFNNTKISYTIDDFNNNENKYNTNSNTKAVSFQIDYNKILKNKTNIDFGAKYSDVNRNSDLLSEFKDGEFFIENTSQTTAINYKERISALYISADKKIKEKNYIKLGLRAENTDINKIDFINNTPIKNNYTNFFPSFYYSRTITDNKSASFGYSRSLKRPNFGLLNNDIDKINDFQYYIGNPDLKPEFIDKYELNYNLSKHHFSIYYKNTKDKITEIYFVENDIAYFQTINLGFQKRIGIEYGLSEKIKKWWSLNMSSYIYNSKFVNEQGKSSFEKTTFGVRLFNNFKLNKTTSIDLSGFYQSPSAMAHYKGYDVYSANLAFKKSFLSKKLNLRIDFNDIFNTLGYETFREFDTFNAYYYRKPNRRALKIKLIYSFSNNKKVSKNKNRSKSEINRRL